MDEKIPGSLEEMTAAWLTTIVRTNGVGSPDAEIATRHLTVLGTGEGFAGELARIGPVYVQGHGPASLVAKIPTSIEENRVGSEMLNVYERELRVYEELLPRLDVPAPQLLHGAIEPNPVDSERQMELVRRADRLPIWILRLLSRLLRRFAKQNFRRSVMLVEDLAPAVVGDQVAGCDADTAGGVLDVAARLHAATWGHRAPEVNAWLQRSDIAPRVFHAGFLDARKGFLRRADGLLSEHTIALVKHLKKHGATHIADVHATMPLCLLHGDLRLDNIFFDGDGSVRALIDWQLTNLGPALIDVTYFITGSLPPDTPEPEIDELLRRYHSGLIEHGVTDYSFETLVKDYEKVLLLILHRMASLDQVEFGDERGIALVDQWIRRIDARVARVAA